MPAENHATPAGHRRRNVALDEIVYAAGFVFAEKGIANTSLKDVADELGVSRATIYNRVGSREALLRLVVEGYVDLNRRWLAELRQRSDLNPEERLREAFFILTQTFTSHNHLWRIYQRDEREMPDDIRQEQRSGRRAMQEEMEQIIREGVEGGYFQPVDPRLTAFAIFGMINWIPVWFEPRGSWSTRSVAKSYADMVLGGIRRSSNGEPPERPLQTLGELERLVAVLREQLAGDDGEPRRAVGKRRRG